MVQSGGAIEPCDDVGKRDDEPPLVAAPAGLFEPVGAVLPTGRDESRERFDDENGRTSPAPLQEAFDDRLARGLVQLVERERGDEARGGPWPVRGGDVRPLRPGGETETTVGVGRFRERPRMPIYPE